MTKPVRANPRIPWSLNHKTNPRTAFLNDAAAYACAESGIDDPRRVALALSAFLERIADHVSKGHVFSIPGFGQFGPKAERRRYKLRGKSPYCYPVFQPCRGFRSQVRYGTGPQDEAERVISQHGINHAPSRADTHPHERVFSAQQRFREIIKQQLSNEA